MYGGVRGGATVRLALVGIVASVFAAPAFAADLGGNCCSDLEERIAELEATTARKGNRKVSLTVSGWVSEAVFFWDDGVERNVYVGTNSLEQDRFRFVGEAKISDKWSAGYTLEIGVWGVNSKTFSQTSAGTSPAPLIRKSNWWIRTRITAPSRWGVTARRPTISSMTPIPRRPATCPMRLQRASTSVPSYDTSDGVVFPPAA